MFAAVFRHVLRRIFFDPARQVVDRPQRCLEVVRGDIGELFEVRVRPFQVVGIMEQVLMRDRDVGDVRRNGETAAIGGPVDIAPPPNPRFHLVFDRFGIFLSQYCPVLRPQNIHLLVQFRIRIFRVLFPQIQFGESPFRYSRFQFCREMGRQFGDHGIVKNQITVGIKEHEAVRHCLDRVQQPLPGLRQHGIAPGKFFRPPLYDARQHRVETFGQAPELVRPERFHPVGQIGGISDAFNAGDECADRFDDFERRYQYAGRDGQDAQQNRHQQKSLLAFDRNQDRRHPVPDHEPEIGKPPQRGVDGHPDAGARPGVIRPHEILFRCVNRIAGCRRYCVAVGLDRQPDQVGKAERIDLDNHHAIYTGTATIIPSASVRTNS